MSHTKRINRITMQDRQNWIYKKKKTHPKYNSGWLVDRDRDAILCTLFAFVGPLHPLRCIIARSAILFGSFFDFLNFCCCRSADVADVNDQLYDGEIPAAGFGHSHLRHLERTSCWFVIGWRRLFLNIKKKLYEFHNHIIVHFYVLNTMLHNWMIEKCKWWSFLNCWFIS